MIPSLYLVKGHKDTDSWIVAAYTNKEKAEEHVTMLEDMIIHNESREKIQRTLDPNYTNIGNVIYEIESNVPLVYSPNEYISMQLEQP
jgi:hypothetical protein